MIIDEDGVATKSSSALRAEKNGTECRSTLRYEN